MIANDTTDAGARRRQPARYHSRIWVVMTSGRGFRARDWFPGAMSLFAIEILWVLIHLFEPEGAVRIFFDNMPVVAMVWSLYMGTMLSDIGSTFEPLLATGVRRSDIIFGRFLRPALIYLVVVFMSVGLLVLGATTAANVIHSPELTYLQPTAGLCVWLIIVESVAGFESIAIMLFAVRSRPLQSNRRSHKPDEYSENVNRLGNPTSIVTGLICLGWLFYCLAHNPSLLFLFLAVCPVVGTSEALRVIFARIELPGNPDQHYLQTQLLDANLVPAMVLCSLAGTALFLFLAVRDLDSGGRRRRRAN